MYNVLTSHNLPDNSSREMNYEKITKSRTFYKTK